MCKFLLLVLTAGVVALCGCSSAPPIDDSESASAGGTALRLDSTPGGRGPALHMLF
jgi:hypothetical protein